MSLIVASILIALALLIRYGKMYFLIAGYNTMGTKEKAQFHIEGIAKLFFKVCIYMAITMIIGYALALWLNVDTIEIVFFLFALVTGTPYLLIKSNSNRYKL